MKKNKLSIIFIILTIVCLFSLASIANGCGCSLIPVQESKDTEEAGEADVEKEEKTPEEEEPEEETPEEKTPPEDELPEEEPPEEEEPDEGEPAEAPTLTLEIIEGPTYSASDDVCYYRIKANVSGNPTPDIEFSKDDSNGAWGQFVAQVNLEDPSDTYNLTVTATNSEGTATDSMNIIWGCDIPNNPPEISEITFMGDHYMGLEYTFSAAVADPDGNSVSYSWSVSGGSLANPNTNPVKWTMPNTPGNYDITVTVDDGNGGQDQKTETVEVLAIPSTDIPVVCMESGDVYNDGSVAWSCPAKVGDTNTNKTTRGFLSFDISSLSGKVIISSSMVFNNYYEGNNPYCIIEKIWLESVNWGSGKPQAGDYDITGRLLGEYDPPTFTCSNQTLVDELQKAINDGRDRFQLRLSHKGLQTNHDGVQNSLSYGGPTYPIKFSVTYIP
jgi:hypothetical protein